MYILFGYFKKIFKYYDYYFLKKIIGVEIIKIFNLKFRFRNIYLFLYLDKFENVLGF